MRERLFLILALLAVGQTRGFATGDWASAPFGLDHYAGRLPAKSLPELMRDGVPGGADPVLDEDLAGKALRRIAEEVGKRSRAESLASCDAFLETSRRSPGLSRFWGNLGLDLRDCLADAATPDAEAAEYVRWRVDLGPLGGDEYGDDSATVEQIEKRLQDSKGRSAASLHFLLGAAAFHRYEGDKGESAFVRVVEKFPDHPRAETAAFMLGRARLEAARAIYDDEPRIAHLIEGAANALAAYLKVYPKGRFTGDVLGWQGAIACKRDQWATALDCYLRQLEIPGHPENQRSASHMVERVLGRLLAQPDEAPLREIAKRPAVAMGTVYWLVHAPEADLHNGFYDKPEAVRKWRAWWLPRLAAAVKAESAVWEKESARPWFYAILAHAASDAGDQAGALKILNEAGDAVRTSDDLAFVHCVVLERQRTDPKAEVLAWKDFLASHPQTPLRDGALLRLASAQQRAGSCDEAVITVAGLRALQQGRPEGDGANEGYYDQSYYPYSYTSLPPAASALSPSIALAEPVQVAQHLDALLAFAPLPELVRLRGQEEKFTPEMWDWIRASILGRVLAEGVKDYVLPFLPADADRAAAEKIVELSVKLQPVPQPKEVHRPGREVAADWLALGDAWAAARGRVTYPPLLKYREEIYREADSTAAEELRVENAVTLGLSARPSAQRQLLLMDEFMNAKLAWEKAAKAATPGGGAQAKALERILEAMPRIAAATPWARSVAAAQGWTEEAAGFYERLQKDCAGSEEARRAACPSFHMVVHETVDAPPEPLEANPDVPDAFVQSSPDWVERLSDGGQPYVRHREFLYDDIANFAAQTGESGADAAEPREDFNAILQELYAIDFSGAAGRRQLLGLRDRSRKSYAHWSEACVHSAIEDLAALEEEKNGPPPAVFVRYAALRLAVINTAAFHIFLELKPVHEELISGPEADEWVLNELTRATADPALKAVVDRVACLRLLVMANQTISLPIEGDTAGGETTIETRNYAAVEQAALAWLEAYPRSHKREEAWLLCARAAYRARRPLLCSVGAEFPITGDYLGGWYVRSTRKNLLPWDAAAVEGRIKAYEKEFPHGRYAVEMKDLRAGIAVQEKAWDRALQGCLDVLGDKTHLDLHPDAALRLTNIFAQLANPDSRPALLEAIEANPAAQSQLILYLDATDQATGLPPLLFLTDWLRQRMEG